MGDAPTKAPAGEPQDAQVQALLRHVAADLCRSLAMSYPDMASVQPSKIEEAAIAAAMDSQSYGPILERLASGDVSKYVVQIDFIRPAVLAGSEDKVVARIAGKLDPQICDDADQLMQCVTVLGLLTSPAARARLYLSGVKMNLRLGSYEKPSQGDA